MRKITPIILFLLSFTTFIFAQSSYIDTSFGDNGVSNHKITEHVFFETSLNMGVTDSGKIVKTCLSEDSEGNQSQIIAQYTNQGNLDTGFGNNGVLQVTTDFNVANLITKGEDIYLSGISTINGKLGILKLNSTGNIATSFGSNGFAFISDNILSFGLSIKIDSNNKFVVAGKAFVEDERQLIIARFNENGSVDTSFGNNGVLQFSLTNIIVVDEFYNFNLELFDNDSILVTGTAELPEDGTPTGNLEYNEFAVKTTPNGTLDTTFGTNGIAIYYDVTASGADVYASHILSNDKILMSIDGFDVDNGLSQGDDITGVLRLNVDGTIDTTFGVNGLLKVLSYDYYIFDIFQSNLDSDAFILVEGNENEEWNFSIVKISENGVKDNSFAENGVLPLDFPNLDDIEAITNGIELPDGKILVSGMNNYEHGFTIGRFFKENLLSVEDNKFAELKMYPNPVTDYLNIKSNISFDSYKVFQVDGKLVLDKKRDSNLTKMNMSTLQKGMYIIELVAENNLIHTMKFIKL